MLLNSHFSTLYIFILLDSCSTLINEEICFHEWFKPQCRGQQEIVLIQKAIYGRMELGKCLSTDDLLAGDKKQEMFFGCHVDVTTLLNQKCFAKSSCEVYVSDEDFIKDRNARPCFKGLFMYLKVEYRCVINPSYNNDRCVIPVTSDLTHILMTLDANKSSGLSGYCGHYLKPWILESSSGQYIDFQLVKHNLIRTTDHRLKCHNGEYKIGYMLTDGKVNSDNKMKFDYTNDNTNEVNNITICIDLEKPQKNILNISTKSSKLQLVLFKEFKTTSKINEMTENYVLLKLKAIGCVDLIPPEDAWLKRHNDISTVGCYSSRQIWTLKCNGFSWQGVIGNCSMLKSNIVHELDKEQPIYPENKSKNKASQIIQFLSIVAICGFGLALCLVIVCIGCIYFKRLDITSKQKKENFINLNSTLNDRNYVNGQDNNISNYDVRNESWYKAETLNNITSDEAAYFVLESNIEK